MPELEVAGAHPATLHYTDTAGAGRPVVLIHGWPLSGAMWTGTVDALTRAGHRAITYDRRGFGRSSKPEGGFDYDTFADDLAALLDHLDLHGAVIIGFSMGGGEVARYIGSHGERRLAGAALVGSITPHLCVTDDDPDGAMPEAGFHGMMDAVAADRRGFLDGFVRTFFSIATPAGPKLLAQEEDVAAGLALTEQASDAALYEGIRTWMTDFRADLPRFTVPTLIVHGDGDQNVPLGPSAPRTHAALPASTLVVIPDAPHGLHLTHAAEFESALLGFLDGLK